MMLLPHILGPRQHLHTMSGGIGTYMSARRLAERQGTANLHFLFTDTLIEDRTLYRFLIEGVCDVLGRQAPQRWLSIADALPEPYDDMETRRAMLAELRHGIGADIPELVWIADGRHPFEVFQDEAFLGNDRIDPCSKILKRQLANRWLDANCDRQNTTVYVGIDWEEEHRLATVRAARPGWDYQAPLCDPPYVKPGWKDGALAELEARGIARPLLYRLGWSHNNCGGACVKAGQAQWAMLLRARRKLYLWWEEFEQHIRGKLGEVSILVDRRGGVRRPLTLRAFRIRLEGGGDYDRFEFGGCGCALPPPQEVPVLSPAPAAQALLFWSSP